MKTPTLNLLSAKFLCLFLMITMFGYSQDPPDINVEILGGNPVFLNDDVLINAGNSITFRITNNRTDCDKVKIEEITLANTTEFSISTDKIPKNVDNDNCKGKTKYIDFVVTNISGNCGATTDIDILIKKDPNFVFTFSISGSPIINVLGGSPSADILNNSTTTSNTNGTFYGVVDEGVSVTRNFVVANTGSCSLNITSLSVTPVVGSGFSVASAILMPPLYNVSTSQFPTVTVNPGSYVVIRVIFKGPLGGAGTQEATINISNTANTTFSFNVSAEMFNYNIPGPGGVTADFRLWLKSNRGITKNLYSPKVSKWADIGTNGKDAIQDIKSKQPVYIDNAASNINFNPVVKFENNGVTEQYLENKDNGFYSQDVFIVMIPDATMTGASSKNTIFAGIASGNTGDMTGIGFGDYSSEFSDETLSYNQDVPGGGYYNGEAELSSSYSKAGIINIRNNAFSPPTGQEILYNSNVLTTSSVNNIAFDNVGHTEVSEPYTVFGTEYWIGKNFDTPGSLNGRVAEIFTFAERVSDANRHKIESYLAIKYGITLGADTEAQKDYLNSFTTDNVVWNISENSGYNFHVAGIGRDDNSDLNQKQSKTINIANEVTIGLGGVFTTNSANINDFEDNGDFLVWGSNNDAFTAGESNAISIIDGGTPTSVTRILRQWKIVETNQAVNADVETVYISIPEDAFSSFTKTSNEEYVLIVADNDTFSNSAIIDVVPLKSDGTGNLLTWYDFHDTKYFTFGRAAKLTENHAISIDSGDYLVGESTLNLNINDFTISAWVQADALQTGTRTIMAKGRKLQLRLNGSHKIEVMIDNDDDNAPTFTSSMALNDNKWHQITFVYNSGTIFLYIDGVLDKSEQNVVAPSPNYNHFSLGALYIDKSNIINPFLGKIDEVYVWDIGLNERQVRYLMNQEIERFEVSGAYFVSGKILPQAALNNPILTIPWNKLKAYYDFNSFYGSTVEGLSDSRNFLRLKYLRTDKKLVDKQAIPVPYKSIASSDWGSASTWLNGPDNVLPNALSLDGLTYIDWNIVETNHNITSGDKNITVLALKSNEGELTIADPNDAQDETNSGQSLTITNYLELDGVIDLVGESQLIQTEGSIVDADSGGYIERDQQGTANGFNYNYWTSSVGPSLGNTVTRGTGITATNTNYTIEGVLNNGVDSDNYEGGLGFDSSPNAGTIPPPGLFRVISSYWLYKFYGASNDYNSWVSINESSSLLPGEGFTMKGTMGDAPISEQQNYVFKGLPNNGDITLALDKASVGGGEVDRLIGNPYPSAIDATEFILDNLSVEDGGNNVNGTVFNGALYFWDHFGEQNSHVLKDYVGGYATRNLIGGAVAISNDSRIDNNGAEGSKIPGQFIPVNQGFFVSTALDGFKNDYDGTITTVVGGDIVFKNSQRVFAREDGSTSLFLKSTSKKDKITNSNSGEKVTPRIKLMYSSPLGYHRQIVLGVNDKASAGFDIGFDAFMADINKEDMYWTFNNGKFVIQGVNDFNDDQEFHLGLIVKQSGIISVKVDGIENIDANKSLYIKDNLTGETYQINDSPFETYLEAGTYEDRFKLVFQSTSKQINSIVLSNDQVELTNKVSVFYDSDISSLEIDLIDANNAYGGAVLNIIGHQINPIKAFEKHISIPLKVSIGVYIIQLETDKGLIKKKIIIN